MKESSITFEHTSLGKLRPTGHNGLTHCNHILVQITSSQVKCGYVMKELAYKGLPPELCAVFDTFHAINFMSHFPALTNCVSICAWCQCTPLSREGANNSAVTYSVRVRKHAVIQFYCSEESRQTAHVPACWLYLKTLFCHTWCNGNRLLESHVHSRIHPTEPNALVSALPGFRITKSVFACGRTRLWLLELQCLVLLCSAARITCGVLFVASKLLLMLELLMFCFWCQPRIC